MSTPYVTIGGKEVSLTPGGVLHQRASALASSTAVAAQPQHPPRDSRPNRTAMLIGLVAALSALIMLGMWLGACRKNTT